MKGLKVFLACAIGAFVGSIVALEISRSFWWVGLLVGGLTGYISYEFKKVLQAVPKAWNKATNWKPDKEWWKGFIWILIAAFCVSTTAIATFLAFALLLSQGAASRIFSINGLIAAFFCWCAASFLFFFVGFINYVDGILDKDSFKEYAKYSNPVSLYFYYIPRGIFYELPRGIFWLIRKIPAGICVLGRFFKHLFILVHSDIRLLCGIDSAIGAAAGYFLGDAIFGAYIGGVFGLINYEVVSKRLLHLQVRG